MRSHLMVSAAAAGAVALTCGAQAASFNTLYQFSGAADGGAPTGNLVAGPNGVLYGVTATGGASGNGTVFQLDRPRQGSGQWSVTTLYSFAGGSDASAPNNLTMDAVGNLYGTSNAGGGSGVCTNNSVVIGCGTVFELSPVAGGGWSELVLYAFQGPTDGQQPMGVSFDSAGNLYGFGFIGGPGACSFAGIPFGCGTAFKLSPVEGAGWSFSLLYAFKNDADSDGPFGPPLIDSQGALYGETGGGGRRAPACAPATGCGEVFRLVPRHNGTWMKQALWIFDGLDGTGGSNALVADWAGNIYGMTNEGGPPNPLCPEDPSFGSSAGCGVAFELSPPANGTDAWTYHTIWDFTLGPDSGYPFNASITLADGRLFTTSSGPYPLANSYGAIVEFLPSGAHAGWKERTLFTFSNDALNEAQPESSLFWSGNRLYGTAAGYGTAGSFGSVFRVKP
ncbi:MAG TPA: choice-of-anchor tandem repeat GloVer-containing protein [Acetobacteraceae bacterium]|nr:choice-of-anchor tandem repeat GloVer-containing protein [Acetobacteraceae bacterium]